MSTEDEKRSRSNTPEAGLAMDRRDLLKLGALGMGAAALGTAGCATGADQTLSGLQRADLGPAPDQLFSTPPMDLVRIGMVGVGLQGTGHLRNFLRIAGVHNQIVRSSIQGNERPPRVSGKLLGPAGNFW